MELDGSMGGSMKRSIQVLFLVFCCFQANPDWFEKYLK
jgi:hypothetical protein